jgi:hypothetical protein
MRSLFCMQKKLYKVFRLAKFRKKATHAATYWTSFVPVYLIRYDNTLLNRVTNSY